MPDYHSERGSSLPRFLVCLLALAGVAGCVTAVGAVAGFGPMHAEAAGRVSGDWSFAPPAIEQLRVTAVQVCGAEKLARGAAGTDDAGIRQAQAEVLTGEYEGLARDYNQRVRALINAGVRRPEDVPSRALPLDLAREQYCLRTATSAPLAQPTPVSSGRFITLEQLDAYAAQAGWPNEPGWWPEMRKIVLCETRSLDTMAHNTSDPNGGSYGLAQLNGSYHFERAGEDFAQRFDPVVNLRTALWLRTVRGHFGGFGGWANCSALWGID